MLYALKKDVIIVVAYLYFTICVNIPYAPTDLTHTLSDSHVSMHMHVIFVYFHSASFLMLKIISKSLL